MATHIVTTAANNGARSLRQAIAQSQSGDTIAFDAALTGQTITLTSGQIEIPAGHTLTIDGVAAPGLAISGNQTSRIFLLNSTSATPSQLTVKNLTLTDGYTNERGGAISTTHQGELVIENVNFTNNVADEGGGAIFSAFEGRLTVTDSEFTGNQAIARNDERGAGAIAFWGPREFTVRRSTFTNNRGINGGAINNLNGQLTIEDSTFINNDTTAAVYDTGNSNPFLRGYGGAIYTDRASTRSDDTSGTIRISNSRFESNRGRGEGGAAYLFTGAQDNVVIETSSFLNNRVSNLPQGNDGNGGALVVQGNDLNRGLTIDRTTFANNTASHQGGGLWMRRAPTTITNSTFSGNRVTGTASDKVGGGMALYGPTEIINSTIANNHAGWVGGGISVSNNTVTVKNTIFYDNTADNGTNDWGIQQHTNQELSDRGGNLQWPPKQTNRNNDYNATATIQLVDPKLTPLQDNGGGRLTHALLADSPAIDAGDRNGAPTIDQRGAQRDSNPDSGAVEFGVDAPSAEVPIGDAPTDGTNPSTDPTTDPGGTDNSVGSGSGTPSADSAGGDRLDGTDQKDRLIGGNGKDILDGKAKNDLLKGGKGADQLLGGAGKDRLLGQAGNDVLVGGRGKDLLIGGKGKDIYQFDAVNERVDTIRGFEIRRDRIDVGEIFAGDDFTSRRPFRDYIDLKQSGSRTVVRLSPDGGLNPQRFKTLAILPGVDASDLSGKQFITST